MSLLKKLLLAFTLLPAWAMAQKYTFPAELYQVATIPDSLKARANSVVRMEQIKYEVKSPGKAVKTCNRLITLLNSQADDELSFVYYYDDFASVNDVEIKVYNQFGVLDRKYSKKDMRDVTADGGSTLISDNRLLYLRVSPPAYPASIEVSYKYTYNGLIDYDDWEPQSSEQSVQTSIFNVSIPESQGLRYQASNIKLEPSVNTKEGMKNYTWMVKNLRAIKTEEGSMSGKTFPQVDISPAEFEIDNVKGNLSSWADFGRFYYQLAKTQSDLSPQRQQEIQAMTAGLKTDREKIDSLYRYMQQNMRYVSIQLGIGGWKPLAASFVDSKKYGDCKALTNYMQAMLKAVNIPSYQVLVRAGKNEAGADQAFPNNRFNHVILMVPQARDTVWLECTSTTNIPGQLGTFTENRKALLVKEEGSYLQDTPPSTALANSLEVNTEVELHPDGSAAAVISLAGCGEYRDDMIHEFARQKTDEQKSWLINVLGLKQPDEFSITHQDERAAIKKASVQVKYDKLYEFAAGTKQFYSARLPKLWRRSLPADTNRRSDFYLDCPLIKSDKTVFHLPEGFEPENLPAKEEKVNGIGTYKSEFIYDKEKNTVTAIASLKIPSQRISAKQYNTARVFFDEVIRAEARRLIIRKKTM